jgi:hypothetical protein
MVVVAYLRVFCTKRPAMGLLVGVHFLPKMGVATKPKSYHWSNAYHTLWVTIGVYTFSKITMSLCPPNGTDSSLSLDIIQKIIPLFMSEVEWLIWTNNAALN